MPQKKHEPIFLLCFVNKEKQQIPFLNLSTGMG